MTLSRAWVALEGAARYLTLPQVEAPVADARARVCAVCPHLVHGRTLGIGPRGGYCGKPLQPNPATGTCGCLVTWGADDSPAGKTTRVGDCPIGLW